MLTKKILTITYVQKVDTKISTQLLKEAMQRVERGMGSVGSVENGDIRDGSAPSS